MGGIKGVEVWFARDLQKLLGYDKWQRFQGVIARAEIACEQAGNNPADYFTGAGKMVEIGSESQRS